MPVIVKTFILLLGTFLGSRLPTAAQTPDPQIIVSEHVTPVLTTFPTLSTSLSIASLRVSDNLGKSTPDFRLLSAGAYDRNDNPAHPSPIDTIKTSALTKSSVPLIQLWDGRLQLEAFQSTIHLQNLQFGPYGYGTAEGSPLRRQGYPGGLRSIHLSGLALSFQLGRNGRTGHRAQLWQSFTRTLAAVLD